MNASPQRNVTRYIIIAIALLAFAVMTWRVADMIVLGFGGVVMAVVLYSFARGIQRLTGWQHRWNMLLAIVTLLVACCGLTWAFGSQIAKQFAQMQEQLPEAVEKFQQWVDRSPIGKVIVDTAKQTVNDGEAMSRAGVAATAALAGVGNLLLLVFLGVYFASDPTMYREGALRLLPPPRRPQVRRALNDAGSALQRWLLAQLAIMVAVGTLTGIGLGLLGVPLALLLGLLMGLLEFIPVVGPIAAAIPGLLLAFAKGPETVIYVALVYIGVQQLESNVLTPLIQRWAVELPPVVALLAIVAGGLLFGVLGVIFATPLAVVVMAMVQHLYVEDTLEGGRAKSSARK